MGRLALVGGNSLIGSSYGQEVAGGEVAGVPLADLGSHLLLQRHGVGSYTLPHAIDHVANMSALAAAGVDRVLALGSVGGMRDETPVGTILAPDDFIALGVSPSIHSDAGAHGVPGFDHAWRARVVAAWGELADVPLVDGGIYWQSAGPRFETPAEIRLFAGHAHVVGMTVASEAVVARELGIAYAAVCTVDNMANGLGTGPLTIEEFERGKAAGHERLIGALEAVLPALAREPA
jgi:5'-methylthioadenosine phosphorylase